MGVSRSRARRIALLVVALLAMVAVAAILVGGGDDEVTKVRVAATKVREPGCKPAEPHSWPDVEYNAPKGVIKRADEVVALVNTNCGEFEIALDSRRAPKTVNSFASLSRKGFYEYLTFDRVIPGLLIEGGDPPGKGVRGPGYRIVEEPPPGITYTRGTVAMSKSRGEPSGSSRSQFFIVLARNAQLPPEYALIGRVYKGFDVVERIGRLGTPSGKPKRKIMIDWIFAKNAKPQRGGS